MYLPVVKTVARIQTPRQATQTLPGSVPSIISLKSGKSHVPLPGALYYQALYYQIGKGHEAFGGRLHASSTTLAHLRMHACIYMHVTCMSSTVHVCMWPAALGHLQRLLDHPGAPGEGKGRAGGSYIHTYVRTYVHTYIHTYVHAYIHTYITYKEGSSYMRTRGRKGGGPPVLAAG